MFGYIYLILNKINGKTYIGKRKLYKKAWNKDNYLGSGTYLLRAKEKYGIENFEKFLICYTESEEDACEKEKFWIAHYRALGKAEYNITAGGDGNNTISHKGYSFSNETKKQISNKVKALWQNEEYRRNQIAAMKASNHTSWLKGKHLPDEMKKKLSEINTGKCLAEETRRKISEANSKLKWYTNGIVDVRRKECPNGYVEGRSRKWTWRNKNV